MVIKLKPDTLSLAVKYCNEWAIKWAECRGIRSIEMAERARVKKELVETLAVYVPDDKSGIFVERKRAKNGDTWFVHFPWSISETFFNHKAIGEGRERKLRRDAVPKYDMLLEKIGGWWIANRWTNRSRFEAAEKEEKRLMERHLLNLAKSKMLD